MVNETGAREYLNNWQKSIPQKINIWTYPQIALSNVDNLPTCISKKIKQPPLIHKMAKSLCVLLCSFTTNRRGAIVGVVAIP